MEQSLPISSSHQPPVASILLSVSMILPFLGSLGEWNHTVSVLLYLASFPEPKVFKVRPHCSRYQCFIPFYG